RSIAEPTKANVVRQFARDVDLVRALAGDMTRLGAMSAGLEAGYSSLGIQMAGPRGIIARWSVHPVTTSEGAQLIVLGTKGKAAVSIRSALEPWTTQLAIGGQTQEITHSEFEPGAVMLERLRLTLAGEPPVPDWVDACRDVELAETI